MTSNLPSDKKVVRPDFGKRPATAHDWVGPDRVNVYVHCRRCGKIFEVLKSKGECRG